MKPWSTPNLKILLKVFGSLSNDLGQLEGRPYDSQPEKTL